MVQAIQLVRHGHHALLGLVLCGRMPGVALDRLGRSQMARCAKLIGSTPLMIQSSPQGRARQSACIVAAHFRVPVEIVPATDEIDCGDWTGRSFLELEGEPGWARWNNRRGTSSPPDGESMRAVQLRMVRHLEWLRNIQSDGTIVIVSHAEPIRAALLHYAGIPLDDFLSIEVEPASISTLTVKTAGLHIARINQRVSA